ncbi:MAG: NUDIX domain-containing protein, partial [bacterium]|nr:NUDIX domain-containing protein [bacterium]
KDFSADIWEYITGRMNQFEKPEDGLRREIMEEAGIEVDIIKPIGTYHIFRGEEIAEKELIGIMYWCQTNSDKVILSEEHTDYKWVLADEALDIIKKPSMQADIKAFIKARDYGHSKPQAAAWGLLFLGIVSLT